MLSRLVRQLREEVIGSTRRFAAEEARTIGDRLGVDWKDIPLEEFRRGLEVEMEHGTIDPTTNITNDDLVMTGKIAWIHLKERSDYYTRLDQAVESS